MQDLKRHLLAAGAVLVIAIALFAGSATRNWLEYGGLSKASPRNIESMLVSREGGTASTESEYFNQLCQLLKREYVEPVGDDTKLAVGAVRGMVGSLGDPDSLFMNPEQYKVFKGMRAGVFEGIGVEVRFAYDTALLKKLQAGRNGVDAMLLIPDVIVSAVAPGGPAEAAGIAEGDRILRLDGRWALSSSEVKRLRDLQTKVRAGKAKAAELMKLRDELRDKTKNSITPSRARDLLFQGTKGELQVYWQHGKDQKSATIHKAKTVVPAVQKQRDGTIALRFFEDAPQELAKLRLSGGDVVFDLRHSTMGDCQVVKECLSLLAPAARFGSIVNERTGVQPLLATTQGLSKKLKIRLLVDASTRGAAEAFALALTSQSFARLAGSNTGGDPAWTEVVDLPDGSGYSMTTGYFRPSLGKVVTD